MKKHLMCMIAIGGLASMALAQSQSPTPPTAEPNHPPATSTEQPQAQPATDASPDRTSGGAGRTDTNKSKDDKKGGGGGAQESKGTGGDTAKNPK